MHFAIIHSRFLRFLSSVCYFHFPYGSIFCRFDLIKLPLLIISLILNGIMFFHFKKCRNINLKIGVCLFTTIYLMIISNLLEYLLVGSQIISLSGGIEKLNALNQCFLMSLEFKQYISTHLYKSFFSISIHFCPQI